MNLQLRISELKRWLAAERDEFDQYVAKMHKSFVEYINSTKIYYEQKLQDIIQEESEELADNLGVTEKQWITRWKKEEKEYIDGIEDPLERKQERVMYRKACKDTSWLRGQWICSISTIKKIYQEEKNKIVQRYNAFVAKENEEFRLWRENLNQEYKIWIEAHPNYLEMQKYEIMARNEHLNRPFKTNTFEPRTETAGERNLRLAQEDDWKKATSSPTIAETMRNTGPTIAELLRPKY